MKTVKYIDKRIDSELTIEMHEDVVYVGVTKHGSYLWVRMTRMEFNIMISQLDFNFK